MKQIFRPGDVKTFRAVVMPEDVAIFQGSAVHHVYSTFALGRDAEWTTRQFVLDMKDDDEEGIGIYLQIAHKSPAFVGEEITFTGKFESLKGNELMCSFEARIGDRVIATGRTGQKIFKHEKIKSIFSHG